MTAFQTLKPSTLSRDAFVQAFADIYEHSPWVAEKAFDLGQDALDRPDRNPAPAHERYPVER